MYSLRRLYALPSRAQHHCWFPKNPWDLQDPPPPADMVVEVDYMQPQYNEVTGEVEQTPVIREYIMVDIRPGISGKDILIFGISGFLVGAFVGLLITRE